MELEVIEKSNVIEVFDSLVEDFMNAAPIKKVETPLDELGERAAAWAKEEAAKLITDIDANNEKVIANLVSRALLHGWDDDTLKAKMKRYIGLDERSVNAVEAYRANLLAQGIPKGKVQASANAYAKRLKDHRLQTIASFETQRALNAAQLEIWRTMIDDDQLSPSAVRYLEVHKDDRMCGVCGPLRGRYASIAKGGGYQTVLGFMEFPPFHPNCRCYERVDFSER